MSQDVIADGLNQIMNSLQVEKREVKLRRYSKVLINLLEMMKKKGHLDYNLNEAERVLTVNVIKLNKCQAVKPRYTVKSDGLDRYLRRFLPSRNFGVLVVSTSKGLMAHQDAVANKLGGSLIAYFY